MNDPNGLIFWKGRYHMFYQCNPASTEHTNVCWGHAASEDLVHWEDLPLALAPTLGSPDEDGCWSGCAVVHEGSVYLLYTGVRGKRPNHRQRPCLARALDDGLVSFEKLAANPVISEEPLPGLIGFRDHTVRRVDGGFHQLIGSGSEVLGGCTFEYRSTNLVSWDYSGVFLDAKSSDLPGAMWECPDLFRLGTGGSWSPRCLTRRRAGSWRWRGISNGSGSSQLRTGASTWGGAGMRPSP